MRQGGSWIVGLGRWYAGLSGLRHWQLAATGTRARWRLTFTGISLSLVSYRANSGCLWAR